MARLEKPLSFEAARILADGCAEGMSAAAIAALIRERTGETVAVRTLSRRAAAWRAAQLRRQTARERIEDLAVAMQRGSLQASDGIMALAYERLLENPDALSGSDPLELQALNLKAEELRLKRRQLEVRERQMSVAEKKLQMLEEREAAARAALEDQAEVMTPEERVRRIKEIYGLAS